GQDPALPCKYISCVGNGLDRSAKSHHNPRVAEVVRPYEWIYKSNFAHTAHIFVQNRLKMFKNTVSLQNVAKL
ncbi:MAG: hypothetical protein ACI4K6_01435, partial [Candidatus Fimenecus sp.]